MKLHERHERRALASYMHNALNRSGNNMQAKTFETFSAFLLSLQSHDHWNPTCSKRHTTRMCVISNSFFFFGLEITNILCSTNRMRVATYIQLDCGCYGVRKRGATVDDEEESKDTLTDNTYHFNLTDSCLSANETNEKLLEIKNENEATSKWNRILVDVLMPSRNKCAIKKISQKSIQLFWLRRTTTNSKCLFLFCFNRIGRKMERAHKWSNDRRIPISLHCKWKWSILKNGLTSMGDGGCGCGVHYRAL